MQKRPPTTKQVICYTRRPFGAVAQLGERIVRNDEVVGSIPISSIPFLIPALENSAFALHAYPVVNKSKNVLELALICCFASVFLFAADVKLRIYLQDGTLESGNLVNETPESFVVLTRDGRTEVPKDKIMFINGKTLKQWQERPDKFFQTEILPSDIPNPAYVNDKAALPSPPTKSVRLKKTAVPANKPTTSPSEDASAVAASDTSADTSAVSAPTPVAVTLGRASRIAPSAVNSMAAPTPRRAAISHPRKESPVAATKTDAVSPTVKTTAPSVLADSVPANPSAVVPALSSRKKRHGHAKNVSPSLLAAEKSVPPAVATTPASAVVHLANASLILPARFSRTEYAAAYYQQALHYIDQNQQGQALHSLHVAAILNRQDPEPTFLLGKIYLEQGLLNHAHKFLSHPILKKRADAKELLNQIALRQEQKKQDRRILYGATGAGVLAWIPLLLLMRKMRRAPRRIITAETAMPSPFPDKIVSKQPDEILPILEDILATKSVPKSPGAPEPAFMKLTPEVAEASYRCNADVSSNVYSAIDFAACHSVARFFKTSDAVFAASRHCSDVSHCKAGGRSPLFEWEWIDSAIGVFHTRHRRCVTFGIDGGASGSKRQCTGRWKSSSIKPAGSIAPRWR